jgi:hypothetical protein
VHAVADVQDTPLRPLNNDVPRATVWTVQLIPVQRSATVTPGTQANAHAMIVPTPEQAVAEVHETAYRGLPVFPPGLGMFWLVQVLPSQNCANGTPR